jgi:ribokinase
MTVDTSGENSIVVASGANANLQIRDVEPALSIIASSRIVLLQLEIPMDVVHHVAAYASEKGATVILNPAPATALSRDLLQCITILTPNETEAGIVSGIPVTDMDTAEQAARVICSMGVKIVILTMGEKGAIICENSQCSLVEAIKVTPVDTTAAGDVFNGALAVALSEGADLRHAVQFAAKAAAISVTRLGAQSSIPYRRELQNSVNK